MKGFTVITSDEKKAGHVVEEQGEYLIVEHGALRKHLVIDDEMIAAAGDALWTVLAPARTRAG